MQGYNATVFAYGPTVNIVNSIIVFNFYYQKGTGKTYTMLGYSDIPGLCSLTI